MEKLIDKLGLYDIWTTLFPGGVFLIFTRTMYVFMNTLPDLLLDTDGVLAKLFLICKAEICVPNTLNELLIFFMIAYVSGSVLHELGSIFKSSVLYRAGKPTEFLFSNDKGLFSSEEIQRLQIIYNRLMGTSAKIENRESSKQISRELFHIMNTVLQREKISSRYVKLNVIYNTCITLSIAFMTTLCMVILFDIEYVVQGKYDRIFPTISLAVGLLFGVIMLVLRGKKYYRYWVRNIVFAYYEWDENVFSKAQEEV